MEGVPCGDFNSFPLNVVMITEIQKKKRPQIILR